jgi:hypothetical protein
MLGDTHTHIINDPAGLSLKQEPPRLSTTLTLKISTDTIFWPEDLVP